MQSPLDCRVPSESGGGLLGDYAGPAPGGLHGRHAQQQRQAKRTVGAGGQQTVAIFNSLAHERSDVAFLPIDGEASCASVRDESTGSLVPTQLNATGVFFKATVPGFGISIFTVNIDNDRRHKVCSAKAVITTKGPARLENQAVAVLIDADSKVSGLQDKISNVNTTLQMQYGLYENVQGGAYSMVETQKSTPQTSLKLESIVEGPVFPAISFVPPLITTAKGDKSTTSGLNLISICGVV